MQPVRRLGALAAATTTAVTLTLTAGSALADSHPHHALQRRPHHALQLRPHGAVFVQTDNPGGNAIAVYDRGANGALSAAGTYQTGGRGGVLAGSVVDHLASQNSLVYDAATQSLLAVNAGSDTVSLLSVDSDRLALRQVVSSGGSFPVSIAVHGDLVYVLNALNGGSVQGFRLVGNRLTAIPGSSRALGLDPNATPQYVTTPGDIAFTPGGRSLIVTTKDNGNDIDVFAVDGLGQLSAKPVVNSEPGTVPFAVAFDPEGRLAVGEAGTNAVATFELRADGTLALRATVDTGQSATCWLVADGPALFAGNAGSGTESAILESPLGSLELASTTATDGGTVDAAASPDGSYLYVQTGADGIVDEFRVGRGASLTEVGSELVPNSAGGEGIATS